MRDLVSILGVEGLEGRNGYTLNILAGKIPLTEEPDGLVHRVAKVGHN